VTVGGRGWLLIGASAFVLFAIAVGFFAVGSPQEARRRQLDRKRVEDLQGIASDLTSYATRDSTRTLPASLSPIDSLAEPGHPRVDPGTKAPYEYRRIDDMHYELCATFESELREQDLEGWEPGWAHPAGRTCFSFDVKGEDRLRPIRRAP
jgi:hypothetical protein